jgi:hypothetical protein
MRIRAVAVVGLSMALVGCARSPDPQDPQELQSPNFLGDSVSILLGIGNGHFEPAVELKYAAPTDPNFMFTTPYGIVAADFNGDGKIDFATANAGSDDLTVRLNIGQKH